MHRRTLKLVLGVLFAAMSLIIAGAAGGTSQKASAGVGRVRRRAGAAVPQRLPRGLQQHVDLVDSRCRTGVAVHRLSGLLAPRRTWAARKVLKKRPFTLRVTLKKAKWSDGKAITADDLIFTWHEITTRTTSSPVARAGS